MSASTFSAHADFCRWHIDNLPHECSCGAILDPGVLRADADVAQNRICIPIPNWDGPREIAPPGVRIINGPSILMGDGSYFDYTNPEGSTMTIEDFAYGLAYEGRFRGQTRARLNGNRRVMYSTAEHCVRGARQMLDDGHGPVHAYAFLMHEGGEPTCGDMTGPMKMLCPDYKAIEKRCERAALRLFGVAMPDPVLIKAYDLRMLSTEKRDLMPQSGDDEWGNAEDCSNLKPYPAFDFEIIPYAHPDIAAEAFLALFDELTAAIAA